MMGIKYAFRMIMSMTRGNTPVHSPNRDREAPYDASPPTPPGIRITYHGGSMNITTAPPGSVVASQHQIHQLSRYLRGWINYFGIAHCYQLCCDLDHWIRRRVRMAYWRQWRKPRTKVRNLIKLGVPIQAAVACGITSKGPWRSSKTPGINQALSLAYLKQAGLVTLRDGWIRLHHF